MSSNLEEITSDDVEVRLLSTPEELDEKLLSQINAGKASVRDIEQNSVKKKINEPNLMQEEVNLSQTIGFKTKIAYSKSGKGNI